MEDFCSCCNLSKRSRETHYWDGTIHQLQIAGGDGCLKCRFLAQCIAIAIPGSFEERSRFRVWKHFQLCELTIYQNNVSPQLTVLDIFALSGESLLAEMNLSYGSL
jgi:hypothetical protein